MNSITCKKLERHLFFSYSSVAQSGVYIFICRRSRADLEVIFGVLIDVLVVDVLVVVEPLPLLSEQSLFGLFRLSGGSLFGFLIRVPYSGSLFGFLIWVPYLGSCFGSLIYVPYFCSLFWLLIQVPYTSSLLGFLIGVPYLSSLSGILIQVPYLGFLFRFLTWVSCSGSLFGFLIQIPQGSLGKSVGRSSLSCGLYSSSQRLKGFSVLFTKEFCLCLFRI